MLVDLHAHFPMHLLADEQQRTERARRWWRQRWQGRVVELISRVANYQGPGGTPSVTEQLMHDGDVGVALSMLYQPFDEIDLTQSYGAPPRDSYFKDIVDQHQTVEDYVNAHRNAVAIAHSVRELDSLLGGGVPILIHAIEGGFQLGQDPAEVRSNVKTLADLGVAYVTVAHLFFREVATNAPAIPFLPDWLYNLVFPQAQGRGSDRARARGGGRAGRRGDPDRHHAHALAVDQGRNGAARRPRPGEGDPGDRDAHGVSLRRSGVLVRRRDDQGGGGARRRARLHPLQALHHQRAAWRQQLARGLARRLCKHIDKVHELTGSYDHIAIGSDLDGYIKPALPGLEDMRRMTDLQAYLHRRYGATDAEKICNGNALRVLRAEWGHKRARQ